MSIVIIDFQMKNEIFYQSHVICEVENRLNRSHRAKQVNPDENRENGFFHFGGKYLAQFFRIF